MRLQLLQGPQGGHRRQRLRGGVLGRADDPLCVRDLLGDLGGPRRRFPEGEGGRGRGQGLPLQAEGDSRRREGRRSGARGRHVHTDGRGVHRAGCKVRGRHRDGPRGHARDGRHDQGGRGVRNIGAGRLRLRRRHGQAVAGRQGRGAGLRGRLDRRRFRKGRP